MARSRADAGSAAQVQARERVQRADVSQATPPCRVSTDTRAATHNQTVAAAAQTSRLVVGRVEALERGAARDVGRRRGRRQLDVLRRARERRRVLAALAAELRKAHIRRDAWAATQSVTAVAQDLKRCCREENAAAHRLERAAARLTSSRSKCASQHPSRPENVCDTPCTRRGGSIDRARRPIASSQRVRLSVSSTGMF